MALLIYIEVRRLSVVLSTVLLSVLTSPVCWWSGLEWTGAGGPSALVFLLCQSVSPGASYQDGGAALLKPHQLVAEPRDQVGPVGGMWAVSLCLSLICLHSCQAYLQDGKRAQHMVMMLPPQWQTYGGCCGRIMYSRYNVLSTCLLRSTNRFFNQGYFCTKEFCNDI